MGYKEIFPKILNIINIMVGCMVMVCGILGFLDFLEQTDHIEYLFVSLWIVVLGTWLVLLEIGWKRMWAYTWLGML